MSFMDETVPALSDAVAPPLVRGTADLTSFAYRDNGYEALLERIGAPVPGDAAWMLDASVAAQLAFRRAEGLNLQDAALAISQLYRVGPNGPLSRVGPSGPLSRVGPSGPLSRVGPSGPLSRVGPSGPLSRVAAAGPRRDGEAPLRLLALMGPGDLMTNAPLDFLTNFLDVRLDLLYVLPDRPLPVVVPDHDIAFFAIGEADPATLARLRRLFAAWPRPALNDPRFLPALERDTLSRSLAGIPGICSPAAVAVSRAALCEHLETGRAIEGFGGYPCLIRPHASHAGTGLSRIQNQAELADYLRFSFERRFFVTAFEEYSGADGFYRKSRVAFIDRQPFLCHMAISSNWMVHYLNAGMTESADKRAMEAAAMAEFDAGFARRHAAAFEALHERLGFDYYSIDCAETRDGRLLVFEADAAAIVHLMDPPDMFPYKQAAMHKLFAAFHAMLERRATSRIAAGV